jgi:hypothetical protein
MQQFNVNILQLKIQNSGLEKFGPIGLFTSFLFEAITIKVLKVGFWYLVCI